MGAFLPVEALPGLRKYKYASEDRSLLSHYVLKPLYSRLVQLLPQWLAPNMVTLMGLFFSVDSFARALHYGMKSQESTPRWVYFTHATELILYQTFDALDGQQARRTGTSSPLGELFDHCVDAINTSLQAYVCATVFQLSLPQLLLTEALSTANFFVSTWEEYHTHKLFLSAFSGPVEGIIGLAIMEVLTGIYGPQIWLKNIGHTGFTYQDLLSASCGLGLIFNILSAIKNVKDVKPKDFSKSLMGLKPYAVFWVGFGIWSVVAWDLIENDVFILFYLAIAFTFALLVGRVITAHVTSQSYPMWSPLLLIPFVGAAGHYVLADNENKKLLAATLCGVSFGVYATFVVEIISEITSYLDIWCLSIKRQEKKDQ